MKRDYLKSLRLKREAKDKGDFTVLPRKKRGRPVLLRQELDATPGDGGNGADSAQLVMAASWGILLAIKAS